MANSSNDLFGYAVTIMIVGVVTLYLYFQHCFAYWKKRHVPFLRPTFPFGNMHDRFLMRQSALELFYDFYRKLEGVPFGGVFQVNRPCLLIRDPDVIKQILVKDFSYFQDRGIYVDEALNPLSAHLFNLGGARWKQLRSRLTPTFTSGKMRMMFALMHECANELALLVDQQARAAADVELKEILAKFTTDVIGSCAFGLQCNSMRNPDSEFRAMGRRVFDPSLLTTFKTMIIILLPSLAALFKVQFPEKDVSDFFLKAVKDTMDFREKNNIQRNDFLQLLIQIKNDSKGETPRKTSVKGHPSGRVSVGSDDGGDLEFTDNLLAAQAFVFFLAGFETSSGAMSFTLLELALNPEIQCKLRYEITSVVEDHDGEFTYEAIMKMEYLDKVICETLRKYPPLTALVRECNAPYVLPGSHLTVERGTRVLVPLHAVQNDPRYFPEPHRFDPERFSPEERAKRPPFTYLPFGEGPRLCIGMRFGQLQTKLGLAMLLHRYHFAPCSKTCLPVKFDPRSLLTTSVGGTWLKISPVGAEDNQNAHE